MSRLRGGCCSIPPSDYFKENLHKFDALDFLAELTQPSPEGGATDTALLVVFVQDKRRVGCLMLPHELRPGGRRHIWE